MLRLPLTILAAMILITVAEHAMAQQVIYVQPQRIIVEHHYPQGVTYIPGQGGGRGYAYGGDYGPTTCYRACFHQGRGYGRRGHGRGPRSGFTVGGSYSQYGGRSGISIGGSYRGYR